LLYKFANQLIVKSDFSLYFSFVVVIRLYTQVFCHYCIVLVR